MPDTKRPNNTEDNTETRPRDELWGFIEEENDIAARQAAKEAERAAAKAAGGDSPADEAEAVKAPSPGPNKPKGGAFVRVGFYVSLFLAVVCTVVLCLDYYRGYRDQAIIRELIERQQSQSQAPSEPSEPAEPGERGLLAHLVSAYEENGDMVGWIKLPGTIIDFPVMQGIDNDEYLRANFKKQYSLHGIPFVDYRIDLQNQPYEHPDNLIIYGHNIGDGLMFNDFLNYADPAFYTEHPVIEVSSLYDTRHFKVFAAFISNGEQKNGTIFPYHMYLSFAASTQFDDFIAQLQDRSLIDVDVDLEYGDKLLCISTCTYEFDGARFVVFAREVREGESTEANPVTRNPDPLYPAAFTRLFGGRSDS